MRLLVSSKFKFLRRCSRLTQTRAAQYWPQTLLGVWLPYLPCCNIARHRISCRPCCDRFKHFWHGACGSRVVVGVRVAWMCRDAALGRCRAGKHRASCETSYYKTKESATMLGRM
eukprot:558617-Rhodomonas_salina.1